MYCDFFEFKSDQAVLLLGFGLVRSCNCLLARQLNLIIDRSVLLEIIIQLSYTAGIPIF